MTDRNELSNEQKSAEQEQSSIPETWEDRIQEEITDQNILSDKKKSAERKNVKQDSEKTVSVSQKRNKKASLSKKSTEKQPESYDESDLEFENNTLQSDQALHNSQDLNIKSNETPGSNPRKKTESPMKRSSSIRRKEVQGNKYNLRSRRMLSPSDEKDSPQRREDTKKSKHQSPSICHFAAKRRNLLSPRAKIPPLWRKNAGWFCAWGSCARI